MYRRDDPRFRRQLTQISHNFENANEAAQERLYSISEHCLKPCFISIGDCIVSSTSTCFPRREERPRRARQRPRGRPEASFDFYDDWEQDENDALLAWENEELDGLLSPDEEVEPGRRGIMNYGTRSDARTKPRRLGMPYDQEDQTFIPKTSYFGFLERLPFRRPRGLRYRPSAADLKIRPRGTSKADDESSGHEGSTGRGKRKHGRNRSETQGSERSEGSFSSRGDIFPSDEEDDAVPLDDEFAMALEPQSAGSMKDDSSSGKTRSGRRRSGDRLKRTVSAKSSGATSDAQHEAVEEDEGTPPAAIDTYVPSVEQLKRQEHEIQRKEEHEVEVKREAAERLARQRGLSVSGSVDLSRELQGQPLNERSATGDAAEEQRPP